MPTESTSAVAYVCVYIYIYTHLCRKMSATRAPILFGALQGCETVVDYLSLYISLCIRRCVCVCVCVWGGMSLSVCLSVSICVFVSVCICTCMCVLKASKTHLQDMYLFTTACISCCISTGTESDRDRERSHYILCSDSCAHSFVPVVTGVVVATCG